MSNFSKLLLITICASLAACTQESPRPKPVQPPEQPPIQVETPDFSLMEEEEDGPIIPDNVNTTPDPVTPDAPTIEAAPTAFDQTTFSMGEIKSMLDGFQLNSDPQYLSCAYYGVKGCESQTVYQKAQSDQDADLCDLLDGSEVSMCKDNLWRNLVSLEKDVSLCDNIADDFSQVDCRNSYYLAEALATKDKSLCEQIKPYAPAVTEATAATLGPDGAPIEEPVVTPAEPENFMLEECMRQVDFAVEFETEAPVVDPLASPEVVIPEVNVALPEQFDPAEPVVTPEVDVAPVDPAAAPVVDVEA